MQPFLIFPAATTDFTGGADRLLTPTKAEYEIEWHGAGSLHIEHPADSLGKWQEITNGKIILAPVYRRGVAFPQPFRIHRVTKTRKNGIPMIEADALHVFYDLNYSIFHPNDVEIINEDLQNPDFTVGQWLSGLWVATLQPFMWYHQADEEYWYPSIKNFTFSSDITTYYKLYVNGGTVIEHLVGGADSIVNRTNGYLLCDGFTVAIDKMSTHALSNAFNIAYGLNMDGVTQVVDDSNVLTCLFPTSNLDDLEEAVYPDDYDLPCEKFAEMGYPFSRVASPEFNYQYEEGENVTPLWEKFLRTDAPGYFTRRKTPDVKYTVDLSVRQVSDEILGLTSFEVGDTGTISDPDLGIETTQMIVKKKVDLITQRVKSIELSNSKNTSFERTWGGIISSGQSSLDRRVKSK